MVACGYGATEDPLAEAFSALYNDTFNGILMQNYRAKYAEFTPATTGITLADGSSALRFEDVQPADDSGTELNCPVYGYGFNYDGVPFIVAYIVMDEAAANNAKRDEMKDYVDEMVNTLRAAQLNSTPFVRQYDILSNKWGVLLCQKEYQTNDIRRSSREWL